MHTQIFSEESFRMHMDTDVAAWKAGYLKEEWFTGCDGAELYARYALNPQKTGTVVFVHGFTEFTDKYLELLYYFYNEGYSVFIYDQRGHGHSARYVDQAYLVHVQSFVRYAEDLHIFMNTVVKPKAGSGPYFLFGHSMGGCIAALFLEKHPKMFKAAVLSSPMLKLSFEHLPHFAAKAYAAFTKSTGQDKLPAPGATPFNELPDYENSYCTSKARYLWVHGLQVADTDYQTTSATCGWVYSALKAIEALHKHPDKATLPILICQAELENLVDNEGQQLFAKHAPNAKLVRIENAKHEIYLSSAEVLEEYYRTVFGFLRENGAAQSFSTDL
jgi:lysophospholipase